jgi:uncharacterized protein (TIGR02466 family)
MKIIPAWQIPMYQAEWEDAAKYQEELLTVCYNLQKNQVTSGVAPGAKARLYESNFDFFKFNNDAVRSLLEWCRSTLFEAAKVANQGRWPGAARIGINIHESWCHITQNGGFHDMHTHPNSSWSGIYYIRAGESDLSTKNGCNRFYSPYNPPAYTDIGTRWSSETASIDLPAIDGQLVVFPSWLPHSALPYYGDIERVVIAFNSIFLDGSNSTTIHI